MIGPPFEAPQPMTILTLKNRAAWSWALYDWAGSGRPKKPPAGSSPQIIVLNWER